jgi:hypothetical protein
MTLPVTPTSDGAQGRRSFLPATAAAIASVAVILWMGLGWDFAKNADTYHGKKGDYYSLLVNGFVSGHLYMDLAADPALGSPDPAVRARGSAPLDTSYFKGHLYLYYGVTPAAIILLPYAWLTGSDLDPRIAVVFFVVVGFLFSLGIWRMVAGDHFGRVRALFQVSSVIALAFATSPPLLLTRAMFYELAEAPVYAFLMAACFCIYRVLSGRGRPAWQIGWASLCVALSVGCRPDMILALPVVAVVAFLIAGRTGGGSPRSGEVLRMGAAAVIPAALVGACLAAYNFERFGSIFDFGFSHGQNDFWVAKRKLVSALFIWPNLHWYYLTFPALSPFFPYVFPCRASFGPPGYETGEVIHGQLPVTFLVAFVAASAFFVSLRVRDVRIRTFLAILGYLFAAVFLGLSILSIRADRYMADFQPPLLLGAVLLAGLVAASLEGRRMASAWSGSFAVLALLSSLFNLFAGLQQFHSFEYIRPPTYEKMEAIGNVPSHWLGKLGLLRYGPVEMKVEFPDIGTKPTTEPLVSAGTPQFNDTIYVVQYPGNFVQFMGDHLGYPQPRSDLIPIQPGRPYTLRIDIGAFYPPINHRFFSGYPELQAHDLKSKMRVDMDGKTVLNRRIGSYDAPPSTIEFGREDISMTLALPEFTGKILSVARLPPPAPTPVDWNNSIFRIQCVLPVQFPNGNFPIFSSGVAGHGTLLFVTIMPGNRIRFGVDQWGYGGGNSQVLEVAPDTTHTIEIFYGPLAGAARWPSSWRLDAQALGALNHTLNVWLDGKRVWSFGLAQIDVLPTDSVVDIGANTRGFSTAQGEFPGQLDNTFIPEPEAAEFVRRNLGSQ